MYLDQDLESSRLVSNLHRRNLLRRTFFHNRETYPYSTKDNFDRYPVIHSWINIVPLAKLLVRYTIDLVHSIAYFIEHMIEALGMTFHSLSIFYRGRVLSLY